MLGSREIAELVLPGIEAMWSKGGGWGRGNFILSRSS